MLITKIIENVSGQSFADYMQDKIFNPLGMNQSQIHDDITKIIPNRVTPYNQRTDEYVEGYKVQGVKIGKDGAYLQHHRNAPHYGGSGVITTIEDLLKWSKNMISQEFGGAEFHQLMHQTPKFQHNRDNQAFGLYIGDFNGHQIVAWDGGDWGISSQLIRFPKQEVAIVVLSNLGSGESYRKANQIADILFEEGVME